MSTVASTRTWTEADIAALTPSDIARLNYDEMIDLVAAAQSAQAGTDDGPQVTESDVLVRYVYALRQRCRNKMASG